MFGKIAAVALAAALMAGCATRTEYVEVAPECQPPPLPSLPTVEASALDPLPDAVFHDLREREKRLTDWALEMEAMLEAICAPPGDDPRGTSPSSTADTPATDPGIPPWRAGPTA